MRGGFGTIVPSAMAGTVLHGVRALLCPYLHRGREESLEGGDGPGRVLGILFNRFNILTGAIAAVSLLSGCAQEPEPVTLDVYSWWRESSERLAFDEVIRIHEDAHPDVRVENRADPNAKDLRKIVAGRMLAGAAPSTFQANIGADLLRWALVDTDDGSQKSRNLLTGLGALFEPGAGPDAA